MPELQIDVTVANRFISSLSKSLQALCHGCMEFDNGIEIVGYININIDSGSKVDYVLNEKVLKSTTNSMTFVSNSFLAKKEHQRQTRDGACSPIPQSQVAASYSHQMRGAHFGSLYERTSQFSSHSQLLRGSQKRTRTDGWRPSPKKYNLMNSSMESSFTGQTSQHSQMKPSSTTSSYTDSNFKQPQVPTNSDSDSTQQLQISIKEEKLEEDSQNDLDTEHSGNSPDNPKLDSSLDQTSKIPVKSDPDEASSNIGKTTHIDSNSAAVSEDSDLKDNFLEPCSSEDQQKSAGEMSCQSESGRRLPSFDLGSEPAISKDRVLTDEINIPSTSAHSHDESDLALSGDNEAASDAPIEYDQATEDESCPQPAYEDTGEGSSDAGQFEVIEIDDEDEDVQAMFGDHQSAHSSLFQTLDTSRPNHHHRNVMHNTSYSASAASHSRNKKELSYSLLDPSSHIYKCPACGKEYKTATGARLHYKIKHCGAFDHYCQACGKGFQQKSHLKSHMSLHMQQKDFECTICGSQYAHKTSLTAHQKLAHGVSL